MEAHREDVPKRLATPGVTSSPNQRKTRIYAGPAQPD